MAKVLVTGAAGFIGSHVVELLVREGYDVRAFLRYNSRSDDGNLGRVDPEILENVERRWGDIRDAWSVADATQGCDYVLHLAAQVAIPYSYVNPTDFVQANMVGTVNVLNAVRGSDTVQRTVVTSTSETYGSARYVPMDEAHPTQSQSPYAASKIGADALASSFAKSFDTPVAILRPFNTFGPRQSLRAIIPTIITQLLTRDAVKLGNVSPRRDLTFVKDTARGFLAMMTHENVPFGDPVNIGRGADVSIGELFERLKEITGSNAELVTDAQRMRPEASEVDQLLASTEKAQELFGWTSKYSLDDGLRETVDWLRAHIEEFDPDTYHI